MKQSLLIWGLFLILGFPLLTLLFGEVKNYLHRQENPLEAFVSNLQRLVLPPLVVLLIVRQLLNLTALGIVLQLLETALWIAIVYAVLSLLKVVLITEEQQYPWQIFVPNLFFQVARAALVLGIGAYILAAVWQVDLSQVAAALGVGSIVVALALQDTLSNLVSGFLLLLENPFQKGDWLDVKGTEGQVMEMNWRAVRLQTVEGNVVIIPNGALGKETIVNYNLPNTARGIWLEVGFSYDDPPNKVKKIIRQVLMETKGAEVGQGFRKIISTSSYDDFSINYKVMFMAENYIAAYKARNDFRTRLYYAAKRHGLTIPFPIRHIYHTELEELNLEESPQKIAEYLRSLPYFAAIEPETMEKLAIEAEMEYYGTDEEIFQQGDTVRGLYIIQKGSAILTFKDARGNSETVARASRGDFFGETVFLSGKPSGVSARAADDLQVICLEAEAIANLLAERPLFAKQIDELIDERRKTLRRLRGQDQPGAENAANNRNLNESSILQQFRS
ncbi:MAG: mechanosensitive ion channel family protein [Cyanobacteriota bacterium]|nr:mechanosensitive ion channel family protein [Cyanobacteriota bacterium]